MTHQRAYVQDEYLKMGYYFVKYRLSAGPLGEWLNSFDPG